MKTYFLLFISFTILLTTSCKNDNAVDSQMEVKNNDLVFVQGGSFMMGDSSLLAHLETPVHKVNLNDFYISKYEITQKEWNEIMDFNPSAWLGDNLPVSGLVWMDAIRYCNERSKKENLSLCYTIIGDNDVTLDLNSNGYRLPTEAEWEYTAKGGQQIQGLKYSGSDNLDEVGWVSSNSDKMTHNVGNKKPNELGIYDMSGNVYEWCWDKFAQYDSVEKTNPIGSLEESQSFRIIRGGSFQYLSDQALVSFRSINIFNDDYYNCGIRVVRSFK